MTVVWPVNGQSFRVRSTNSDLFFQLNVEKVMEVETKSNVASPSDRLRVPLTFRRIAASN